MAWNIEKDFYCIEENGELPTVHVADYLNEFLGSRYIFCNLIKNYMVAKSGFYPK